MWTATWVFLSALAVSLVAPMIGHAIKLAEFRQAWINELRKDIADYLGLARMWAATFEVYDELRQANAPEEQLLTKRAEFVTLMNQARVIQWRIKMRINPRQNELKTQDDTFLNAIDNVTDFDKVQPDKPGAHKRWHDLADVAILEARELLKREWDRTKQFLPHWLVNRWRAINSNRKRA